jgi:signal transduction histidine kinase
LLLSRTSLSFAFPALVLVFVIALVVVSYPYDVAHQDSIAKLAFLMVAAAVLSFATVRVDRGHLSLLGLGIGATAILLNPLDAALVGLAMVISQVRRPLWHVLTNASVYAAIAALGAWVAILLEQGATLSLGSRLAVLAVTNFAAIVLVALGLSVRSGESISSILRHNLSISFYLAFAYFALGALLISYVLDGSPLGYLLATIVCVLALALTDTISGRRVRRVLESELSDADRHLFHSRAVEGVIHNLRNHVANVAGYLKEIDPRRLDPVDRENVATAADAANDAVAVLHSLAQGATPRVSYAIEPVDLNELITRALGMARPRARIKQVQLALRESPEQVKVRADPLLLREVITNLVNNAIDAVPVNGHVELKCGRRGNGWPYFSVTDDGPGVNDDQRHRLFVPHVTTKEGGTGLGLFMSYGIVREHQGELLFEGTRKGAVFTAVLPPFSD